MEVQNTKHHLHIGAICVTPVLLLVLASVWNEIETKPALAYYQEQADRAEQKLSLLDTQFRDMQKTYELLTEGEEKEMFPPVAYQRSQSRFDSAVERYADAMTYVSALQNRIAALRHTTEKMGKKIVHIDLSDQEMVLVDQGNIVARYPVSSGKPSTPTPVGKFEIHRKQELRISQQETPYRMPYYMAFTPSQSHGFHALPYLGNGPESSDFWQEALTHIGIPVSHGCVRLLPEDAKTVYQWIDIGTPVYIDA